MKATVALRPIVTSNLPSNTTTSATVTQQQLRQWLLRPKYLRSMPCKLQVFCPSCLPIYQLPGSGRTSRILRCYAFRSNYTPKSGRMSASMIRSLSLEPLSVPGGSKPPRTRKGYALSAYRSSPRFRNISPRRDLRGHASPEAYLRHVGKNRCAAISTIKMTWEVYKAMMNAVGRTHRCGLPEWEFVLADEL